MADDRLMILLPWKRTHQIASLMSKRIGRNGMPTCNSGMANPMNAIRPMMAPLAPREGIIDPVLDLISKDTNELMTPALK